jgi:hypothetical protein
MRPNLLCFPANFTISVKISAYLASLLSKDLYKILNLMIIKNVQSNFLTAIEGALLIHSLHVKAN